MGLFHYLTTYEGITKADALFRKPGYDLVPKTARRRLLRIVNRRRDVKRRNIFLYGASMLAVVVAFMPASHSAAEVMMTGLITVFAAVASAKLLRQNQQQTLRSLLLERPCWECGCALLDAAGGHCPECGAAFDDAEYERIEAALAPDPTAEPNRPGA